MMLKLDDYSLGRHFDGGSWKCLTLETETVSCPTSLEKIRLSYIRDVCVLPPPDCEIREVPRRSPLCWQNNPPDTDYHKNFVLSDTIFLDHVFRRLYEGSGTFRAMLKLSPQVSQMNSIIWKPKGFLAEYQFNFQEVDVNHDLTTETDLIVTPLAVIAHEYRHHYQREMKAAFSLGAPIELHYFFALCLAAEADAMCFGFVCSYEVLLAEGYSATEAHRVLLNEKDFLDNNLTTAFIIATQKDPECHLSGSFSQAVTKSFLTLTDGIIQNYIRTYSEIYREHMGHSLRFAKAAQDNPLIRLAMKTANLNEIGNLVVGTPDTSINSEEVFEASLNRLRTLPFINDNGALVKRPQYMRELKGTQLFDVLCSP